MLLFDYHYLQGIRVAIEAAKQIDVAVAFWGAGADRLFENTDVKIRVICNLQSGGTNPVPISLLQARENVEVRQCSDLHAKLLLTDSRMIIGSANFSTNGLHYELEELQGWKELGVATEDKTAIIAARIWFEELWGQSNLVEDADLARAALAWKRARRYRPIRRNPGTSDALPKRSEMVDRPIYLAVWSEDASSQAATEFKRAKRQHKDQRMEAGELDFYEDWAELPMDALLIDVYVGPRKGVSVGLLYRRVPSLDRSFTRENDQPGSIQVVAMEEVPGELPFTFNAKFRRALHQRLKSISLECYLKNTNPPLLSDFLE